jgi:hypothetical protein
MDLHPGSCVQVAHDFSPSGSASYVSVHEADVPHVTEHLVSCTMTGGRLCDGNGGLVVNQYHGYVIVFDNHVETTEGDHIVH